MNIIRLRAIPADNPRPELALNKARPEQNPKAEGLVEGSVRLILIGLAMEIIYVAYIVAFPLISNTQAGGPAADLEILMRDNRWLAPIYVVGVLLLYYLFWQAMQLVQNLSYATFRTSRFKIVVLAFALLFGFTLVWLYPITANDLFRNVLRGRIWAVYGASPMLSPLNDFPDDPYIAFAGEFGNWVSGYGPLWEIMVQVPLRLGATDMVPGAISLKLVVLLSFLICAALIGWFAAPPAQSSVLSQSKSESVTRASSSIPYPPSSLIALTFFAWNPLILVQGLGNGHNDMVFMALIVLGIILWQRGLWWEVAIALTLAALAKATALLMFPLFGVLLLRSESTWRQRILKGLGVVLIGLVIIYLTYSVLGPLAEIFQDVWNTLTTRLDPLLSYSETFNGLWAWLTNQLGFAPISAETPPGLGAMLTTRRGFAIASGLRMVLREIIPRDVAETLPRATGRCIFLFFYAWLMVQLWRNKLDLVTAGFLAYFSQLMLGRTFRIWYPIWLVPLAALHLTPATFGRTVLLGLTAELSIVNYFVVWRWLLRDLPWGQFGPLSRYWNYWTVMHTLTVPWVFGIPLLGPIVMRWWDGKKPAEKLRI